VADGNRRLGLPETSGPHDRLFIQQQLRGIRRFGYSVSKENFLFLRWDISPMSNPTGFGVFRCAKRRAFGEESTALQ
jgi:hypothetical protein